MAGFGRPRLPGRLIVLPRRRHFVSVRGGPDVVLEEGLDGRWRRRVRWRHLPEYTAIEGTVLKAETVRRR